MIRPYNLGRTERGTASAQLDRFTKTANLITGETTSVAHAVYEIDDYTQGTSRYDVKRPTEDSLTNAQVVFSRGHPVEADTVFQSAFCDGDDLWVAFDDTDGTPSVGDDVGTKADEYKMFKDQTGFKCVAYNATEGLCLVRPFSSGGAEPVSDSAFTSASMNVGLSIAASTTGGYETPKAALNKSLELVSGQVISAKITQTATYFSKVYALDATSSAPLQVELEVSVKLYSAGDVLLGSVDVVKGAFAHLNTNSSTYNYVSFIGNDFGISSAGADGTATQASVNFAYTNSSAKTGYILGSPFTQQLNVATYG